jgi:hypothetical protein
MTLLSIDVTVIDTFIVDFLMVCVFGIGPRKPLIDSIYLITFLMKNPIVLTVDVLIVGVF